jgi:hypothetical protein|tara:strand:+ start:1925 stop:2653 length:729 start_codon:yes stop_codon:yes gene_type:complete
MASTASTLAKVELQGAADNPGTWHTALNDALTFHEEDYRGTVALTAGGSNITLTDTQYVTNQARQLFINITGTATTAIAIIAPDRSQFYIIDMLGNPDGNVVTFKPASGTGFTLERYHQYIVRMDGGGNAEVVAQKPEEVVTLAGTGTYTGSFSQAPVAANYDGFMAYVTFTSANVGAATANFNSKGALAITKNGTTALAADDIVAGMKALLVCDGTRYQIIAAKMGTVDEGQLALFSEIIL